MSEIDRTDRRVVRQLWLLAVVNLLAVVVVIGLLAGWW